MGNERILKQHIDISPKAKDITNLNPTSPYHSKTDPTLDLLLALKHKEQVPQENKEIIMMDTVSLA
jgi:hypothetical protein